MKKYEAKITRKVELWALRNLGSSPCEVKHTRGKDYFSMNELRSHQRAWLYAATTPHGCVYKIPDSGLGYKPFDFVIYKNTPAYVIVVFPVNFYVIEINEFLTINTKKLFIAEAEFHARFSGTIKELIHI